MAEKKTEKGEVFTVTREEWEQMQSMFSKFKDLKEQNDMLYEIADKKRLSQWMARNKKKMPSIIHLRQIEVPGKDEEGQEIFVPKIVVGWRSVKDIVGKNPLTGVWTENQQTELILEDGERLVMFITEFETKKKLVKCKVVGREVNEDGDIAYKLERLDNAKAYTISASFVN